MERPTIKDKAVLAYVEYLESQLSSQDTVKKFRKGIQRQLDLLADEMLDEEFKVSLQPQYRQVGEKYIPVDSGFNSFFDMLTKGKEIVAAIEKFETAAYPKKIESAGQIIPEGGYVEEYLFSNKKEKK